MIEDGEIIQNGNYDYLKVQQGAFADFIKNYLEKKQSTIHSIQSKLNFSQFYKIIFLFSKHLKFLFRWWKNKRKVRFSITYFKLIKLYHSNYLYIVFL